MHVMFLIRSLFLPDHDSPEFSDAVSDTTLLDSDSAGVSFSASPHVHSSSTSGLGSSKPSISSLSSSFKGRPNLRKTLLKFCCREVSLGGRVLSLSVFLGVVDEGVLVSGYRGNCNWCASHPVVCPPFQAGG